jgi:hypothetical protein
MDALERDLEFLASRAQSAAPYPLPVLWLLPWLKSDTGIETVKIVIFTFFPVWCSRDCLYKTIEAGLDLVLIHSTIPTSLFFCPHLAFIPS